jgi:phosphopentomutase
MHGTGKLIEIAFQQQVVVIRHEGERLDFDLKTFVHLAEEPEKELAVAIVYKGRVLARGAIGDVVSFTGTVKSGYSRHERESICPL